MVQKVIKKISVQISKELYNEVNRAMDTLNSIEHQKCMGKKKETHTFIGTSDKIGRYLKSQRNKQKNKSLVD